jgi:hypothetical protein
MMRIVPAKRLATEWLSPTMADENRLGYGVRVFPLRYIAATELQKILGAAVSKQHVLQADNARNLLIVRGDGPLLERVSETVRIFDVDWLSGKSVGLFPVKNADLGAISAELGAILGEENKDLIAGGMIKLLPIERLNALLVISAQEKLKQMNTTTRVHAIPEKLTLSTCASYLQGITCVVDCLDNMDSRYALNRECVEKGLPLIHGGVYGMMGQLTTIIPGQTPCLECIFPKSETPSEPIPIFGPTAGVIASLQALEVIKLIAGVGNHLLGTLLYFNGEAMECLLTELTRRPECPACRHLFSAD